MFRKLCCAAIFALLLSIMLVGSTAAAESVPSFRFAWSIYAGWMPWPFAEDSGILAKHAKKHGVKIELKEMGYGPSLDAFVARQVDAVVMTNMEALDMPAAAGIDTTAAIFGDYSDGNDAVLTRGIAECNGLRGKKIYLMVNTVSHYLLSRMLEGCGIRESDVTLVNTSDNDIAPAFIANKNQQAVVTWNPVVMQIEQQVPGVRKIFTSAQTPGEIMDLLVIRTDVVREHPEFVKALVGAWYEVMGIMQQRGTPERKSAIAYMAKRSGATPTEFEAQLRTTAMYYTAESAAAYVKSKEIQQKMDLVRKFCFDHKLLGENVKSVDVVGISYPDGTIQGNPNNVKLRFESKFMELAMRVKID